MMLNRRSMKRNVGSSIAIAVGVLWAGGVGVHCSQFQSAPAPDALQPASGSAPCPPEAACVAPDGGLFSSTSSLGVPQPDFGGTVQAAVAPPPVSGGTLIVLHDGTTAVASDPDRDAVYIVDLASTSRRSVIALNPGDEPGRLVEDGAGRVHVALRGGRAILTIDPRASTVIARRSVCPAPRGVAWEAATNFVWVACATGELVALPAAGGAVAQSSVVERDIRDIVVAQDGTFSVSSFRAAAILRLSGQHGILRRDPMPDAPLAGFVPRVAWRTIAGPAGSLIVAHQEHSTRGISTQVQSGYGNSLSPESGAVMSMVTWIGADGTVSGTLGVDVVLPVDVALAPDGQTVAVVGAGDGLVPGNASVSVFSLANMPAVSTLSNLETPPSPVPSVAPANGPGGRAMGPSTQGPVAPLDNTPAPLTPANFVDAGTAGAVDVGPEVAVDATSAFAAEAGAIDLGPDTGTLRVPTDPFTLPRGFQVSTFAGPGSEAIAVAFDPTGQLIVQTREPAGLWFVGVNGARFASLSDVSCKDTGHSIFHASAGALVACASCHPEGGDDSHTWLLDGQHRRTPSLRGTLVGTAPYHWPGDEANLPTLVNDVYTRRMNGASLDDSQMGALTRWVQTIPAPPPPSWVDAGAAARGQVLFGKAGCVTCHSGEKFTNNTTVDVGTGQPFQVPPLVGVGWRTPLMHDGCATTVADRFGVCATSAHGSTAGLLVSDFADLTAYLDTL